MGLEHKGQNIRVVKYWALDYGVRFVKVFPAHTRHSKTGVVMSDEQ